MPEARELEVVKEFLVQNLVGQGVTDAQVLRPSVLRSLQGDFGEDIVGRRFQGVERNGKYLLLSLSGDRLIVINPKLTGGLQYCPRQQRMLKRTCVVLVLDGGEHLRYTDDRQMGMFYYVARNQLEIVPGLTEQGPDVLAPQSYDDFKLRLKHFHGEIKGVLTRGRVLAGIGNAYDDEILFAARIYPFRRRKQITEPELRRLFEAARHVVEEATSTVGQRMDGRLDQKPRDFLKVHNKGGQPCPNCQNQISQITANRRITSFCRRCQPGMLIKN